MVGPITAPTRANDDPVTHHTIIDNTSGAIAATNGKGGGAVTDPPCQTAPWTKNTAAILWRIAAVLRGVTRRCRT